MTTLLLPDLKNIIIEFAFPLEPEDIYKEFYKKVSPYFLTMKRHGFHAPEMAKHLFHFPHSIQMSEEELNRYYNFSQFHEKVDELIEELDVLLLGIKYKKLEKRPQMKSMRNLLHKVRKYMLKCHENIISVKNDKSLRSRGDRVSPSSEEHNPQRHYPEIKVCMLLQIKEN